MCIRGFLSIETHTFLNKWQGCFASILTRENSMHFEHLLAYQQHLVQSSLKKLTFCHSCNFQRAIFGLSTSRLIHGIKVVGVMQYFSLTKLTLVFPVTLQHASLFFCQYIIKSDSQIEGSRSGSEAERKLSDCALTALCSLASFLFGIMQTMYDCAEEHRSTGLAFIICSLTCGVYSPCCHTTFSSSVTSFFFTCSFYRISVSRI